jgi:hypothetical protein
MTVFAKAVFENQYSIDWAGLIQAGYLQVF